MFSGDPHAPLSTEAGRSCRLTAYRLPKPGWGSAISDQLEIYPTHAGAPDQRALPWCFYRLRDRYTPSRFSPLRPRQFRDELSIKSAAFQLFSKRVLAVFAASVSPWASKAWTNPKSANPFSGFLPRSCQ